MDLLDSGIGVKNRLQERSLAIDKRMAYLEPQDRWLIELVLAGKISRRGLALALGVTPATLTRRLQRLIARLHDPLIVAIINDGHFLPEGCRDVALAFFLRRWPVNRIARESHRSPLQVRNLLAFVRGWYGAKRSQFAKGTQP